MTSVPTLSVYVGLCRRHFCRFELDLLFFCTIASFLEMCGWTGKVNQEAIQVQTCLRLCVLVCLVQNTVSVRTIDPKIISKQLPTKPVSDFVPAQDF